jgi:hypothetical protein
MRWCPARTTRCATTDICPEMTTGLTGRTAGKLRPSAPQSDTPGICGADSQAKRHATELHDLSPDELGRFWRDVAAVGRTVTALFAPVKLDSLVMGHMCPHVHCHVYPQYRSDDPYALINVQDGKVRLDDQAWEARVNGMREHLASQYR